MTNEKPKAKAVFHITLFTSEEDQARQYIQHIIKNLKEMKNLVYSIETVHFAYVQIEEIKIK